LEAVVLERFAVKVRAIGTIAGATSNGRTASHEPRDLHGRDVQDLIVPHVDRIRVRATEVEIRLGAAEVGSPGSGRDKKERILRVALEPGRRDRKAIIVSADDETAARNADHEPSIDSGRRHAGRAIAARGVCGGWAPSCSRDSLTVRFIAFTPTALAV
jgi:hypothetical protein